MNCSMPGFPVLPCFPEFAQTHVPESVTPSNHLILYRPLLLLPSIFPSIRVFFHESALHIRWPKYWSFSIRISPSNEYSGLITFRIDWFYLLAVSEILKSLLQHHSSKTSTLLCSAFFMVQLLHLYITTGKTIDLTIWTFVDKVISLFFPAVMYGCEGWTVKKAECQRIDAFELWCWRRLLRVPGTARRSNQSILKEINPEYSLEGLMLKLKLQYFGHLM